MTVCPQCGVTIPPDATPGGLCPQCLLKLGLFHDIDEASTPPDTEPSSGTANNSGQPSSGEQFGPYTTIRILGEGGMGIVYLAEQLKPIRRQVALKVIKLGMNTREVIARFESERQALALMDHPNIARVFDAGASDQGQPYFVMEYVSGIPITEYCDKNRLSNRERMELFLQVCQAVQHAHQKGVIHRDIKPSNVLVGERDGQPFPQVIDFGIAKATDQRLTEYTAFTQFGQLVGTPEYMSPEQAEVGGRNVDTTTDVYSLGVLLYQLLVGALPFEGARLREAGLLELLRIIREEDPPTPANRFAGLKDISEFAFRRRTEPAAMRRQLTSDLSCIVLKAIEKNKDRRYSSAADFAGDIRRYLADRPVLARPPSVAYRTRKYLRRLPHKPLYAALAGVVILAVTFEWADFESRSLKKGSVTERQLTINIPENRAFGSNISHDGKQLAFIDTKGLHVRLIDSGETRDIPFPAQVLTRLLSVKWFPNDEKLLLANSDEIWITSIFGGAPHKLQTGAPSGGSGMGLPDPEGDESAVVSPDGSSIAFMRHRNNEPDELWATGTNGENPRRLLTSKGGRLFAQSWSPDGQRLAYVTTAGSRGYIGGRIETVALLGGPPSVVVSDDALVTDPKTNLLWLRDGRLIFASGDEENLWSIRTDPRTGKPSGKAAKMTDWSGINVGALSASIDGSRLAVSKHHNRADVYVGELRENGTRLNVVRRLAMSDSFDYPSGWTRDSKAVLFESSRTGKYQIFKQRLGKDNAEHLIPGSDDQHSPQLSPDGAWILYWVMETEMSTSRRLMRLPISGGSAGNVLEIPVAAQPDFDCPSRPGFCVLTQHEQGHLASYALDPLKGLRNQVARLQDPGGPSTVRVSPDGARLALGSTHGIKAIDLRNGTERTIKLPDGLYLWSLAWTADGTAFFATVTRTVDNSYLLVRVDPTGKTRTLLDRGRNEWLYTVVPSPDSSYLAFSELTFENNVWLLENF